jgi:DNA-binding transcriptional ArsR family regulator
MCPVSSAGAELTAVQNGAMTSTTSIARSDGLARLAGLLADRTRALFCVALLDGRAWTARELAVAAGVAPSTATEHLNRLVAAGLLIERRQGRHRYLQLAGPHVADLLEGLMAHVEPALEPPKNLRHATVSDALARGRTCYDHLAGRLGVAITDAMTSAGLLDQTGGFALTGDGVAWLTATLDVPPPDLLPSRRPLALACLDWTERRSHLGGRAGALVCERLRSRDWIRRVGSDRAVRLTPAGRTALRELLDIDAAALALA